MGLGFKWLRPFLWTPRPQEFDSKSRGNQKKKVLQTF